VSGGKIAFRLPVTAADWKYFDEGMIQSWQLLVQPEQLIGFAKLFIVIPSSPACTKPHVNCFAWTVSSKNCFYKIKTTNNYTMWKEAWLWINVENKFKAAVNRKNQKYQWLVLRRSGIAINVQGFVSGGKIVFRLPVTAADWKYFDEVMIQSWMLLVQPKPMIGFAKLFIVLPSAPLAQNPMLIACARTVSCKKWLHKIETPNNYTVWKEAWH